MRARLIVHTDHWKAYSCISELDMTHRRVNHSKNRIEHRTGVHTNHIEGLWAGVKQTILSRNCSKEKINNHLLEFVWRRKHSKNLFDAFIEAIKSNNQ